MWMAVKVKSLSIANLHKKSKSHSIFQDSDVFWETPEQTEMKKINQSCHA